MTDIVVTDNKSGVDRDAVVSQLRDLLSAAERVAFARQNELNALRQRVAVAKQAKEVAEAEARRLARAVRALDAVNSGLIGRPRGTSDPNGVRGQLRDLLGQRDRWTGTELRDEMAARGHPLPANRISAALASLAKDGAAFRVDKGVWSAPTAEPPAVDSSDVKEST